MKWIWASPPVWTISNVHSFSIILWKYLRILWEKNLDLRPSSLGSSHLCTIKHVAWQKKHFCHIGLEWSPLFIHDIDFPLHSSWNWDCDLPQRGSQSRQSFAQNTEEKALKSTSGKKDQWIIKLDLNGEICYRNNCLGRFANNEVSVGQMGEDLMVKQNNHLW